MAWIPATTPNGRQAAHQARQFGVFLHFGINTPNDQEWSDGSLPVSSYSFSGLNPAQWVATAKAAGATYIIAITKHHDGFTLWNSADTTYGITASGVGNSTDVIGALATACTSQGMKLALYYSLWDRTRNPDTNNASLDSAYNATMLSHLTELLTNYGEICEIWLDGGWQKTPARWDIASLYALMQSLQPNCVLINNQTIGAPSADGVVSPSIDPSSQVAGDPIKYPPTDYSSWDSRYIRSGTPGAGGVSDPAPKTFTSGGNTYYLPTETPITINTGYNWFWHDSTTDSQFQTVAYLSGAFMRSVGQGNNFVLNIPPNKVGVLSPACIAQLNAVATALGLSAGAPLADRAEGKTATASSEYSATYAAAKTLTGQVRGGPRWAAADADLTAPWVYVDLGAPVSVQRVALKEWYDASLNNTTRLGTFSIQTSSDATNWTTQVTASGSSTAGDEAGGTSFQWIVKTFTPVTARYVRLLFGTVGAAPTLNAVRVYGADPVAATPGVGPGFLLRRF